MSVIQVKKYLFIGVQDDLDSFFKRSQEKGFVEFLSPKGSRPFEANEEVKKLIEALKVLKKQPLRVAAKLTKDLDVDLLLTTILQNAETLERLDEEKRLLEAERSRIAPLGYFSLDEIQEIERDTGHHVQFFCVKRSKISKLALDETLISVGSEYGMEYFMTLSPHVESFRGMIELHFDKSLSQIEE